MAETKDYLIRQKIAYFSMEIGLSNNIHTYNGGLGILAGDTIKSSADLKIPLVGITLISKKGHFRQELTSEGKTSRTSRPLGTLRVYAVAFDGN